MDSKGRRTEDGGRRTEEVDNSSVLRPPSSVARPSFPFSAIVGQTQMKRALLLNAIYPGISGVLIRGEKGTAKSTAARALARLLPPILTIRGCPFACAPEAAIGQCASCMRAESPPDPQERTAPLISLPLGATEDRVLGTLDLERA